MSTTLMQIRRSVPLPAGVPTQVVVPSRGSKTWGFTVTNVGANPVTAGTVERRPGAARYSDPEDWNPASMPLAAGRASYVAVTGESLTSLRLTFTSALGTTIYIDGSGQ